MAEKSKLPDMGEISKMAGKLFTDVKNSVSEIVNDYKKNHADDNSAKEKAEPEAAAVDSEAKTDSNDSTVIQGDTSVNEDTTQTTQEETEDNANNS